MGDVGIERLFAGFVLALCALALVRLALGPRRRAAFDAHWQGTARRLSARLAGWRLRLRSLRRGRRERGVAAREAQDLIERARRGKPPAVDREGNVIRPRSFRDRKDLH